MAYTAHKTEAYTAYRTVTTQVSYTATRQTTTQVPYAAQRQVTGTQFDVTYWGP
ncbi:MAG: hypothetical protein ACYCRD_04940 [Leptospirillum sp.]